MAQTKKTTPITTAKKRQSKSTGTAYQEFAGVYDMLSADEHSLKMVPYTQRIFRRFRFSGSDGLDLCCGTGSATLALSEAGYRMVGVDGSQMMLKHARSKARAARDNTKFMHGILPEFRDTQRLRKPESFDFVVSYYDSLNYLLTEDDLLGAFESVAALLRQGGLFVFDLNTAEALKVIWGGQVYADSRDDIAWIWKNQYYAKAKMADARTIFFARQGRTDNWRRFEEVHTERAYKISVVRKLLRKAGFEFKAAYRCFSFAAAKENDYRHCFVATKR
jgi:SAM-dependent methyltransferase